MRMGNLLNKLNRQAEKEGGRFHYEIFDEHIYRVDSMNPFGCDFIEDGREKKRSQVGWR